MDDRRASNHDCHSSPKRIRTVGANFLQEYHSRGHFHHRHGEFHGDDSLAECRVRNFVLGLLVAIAAPGVARLTSTLTLNRWEPSQKAGLCPSVALATFYEIWQRRLRNRFMELPVP